MNNNEKHEDLRKQLWIAAWTSVSNTETCTRADTPTIWADKALAAFDSRFPAPTPEKLEKPL